MESDNSAKAGSNASMGASEIPPPALFRPDSRKEEREEGRRGVVGREMGRRVPEVERLMLLVAWGVVEDILGGLLKDKNSYNDSQWRAARGCCDINRFKKTRCFVSRAGRSRSGCLSEIYTFAPPR